MPDETTAPVEQAVDSEKENLKAELDAMRKKNAELLDEYKKAKEKSKAVPADEDITIPLNPVAAPLNSICVSVPQPASTVEPVKENPRTVEPAA